MPRVAPSPLVALADAGWPACANIAHFDSSRYVESAQIRVQRPADFLMGVLEEHQDVIAAVLAHLAGNLRGVRSVADVLDQLDRNQALRPSVEMVRVTLL